jgi:hypothetical protein
MPVSDDGLPVADGDGEDGEGVMLETEDIGTVDEEAVKNLVETYLSASVASRRAFLKQIGLQKEKGKRGRTAIYHATCPEMQVAMQMWNYGIHNVSVIAGVLTNMEVWSVWIRNRFKLPTSKISQATLAKLLKEQKCEIHKAGRGNSMTTYSKLGAFATQCKDETVAAAAESAAAAAEANTESAAA